MKTDLEVIDDVIELLSVPERWTKDWFAKDKYGRWCDSLSQSAACWCVRGAVRKSADGRGDDPLGDALNEQLGSWYDASEFNDDPDTTHTDIMALLHKTRESLLCK